MKRKREPRGFTLIEVLVAVTILVIGLLMIMEAFPTSYLDVLGSGGQTKAVSFAQAQMEDLKNQAFNPGPAGPTAMTGLDPGFSGTWTITPVAGTTAPNLLVDIQVSVTYPGKAGRAQQTVTLEAMRAQ